jgi:NDP-sugar pyrophosphorylase family protein
VSGRIAILAGGISTRMKKSERPDTPGDPALIDQANSMVKAMIGIGGASRPFLDYLLLNIVHAGYDDIVIVVNEKDGSIRKYYESRGPDSFLKDIEISFATQAIPPGREKPMGTADALRSALIARNDWRGKYFGVCNSDNLYSIKALGMIRDSSHVNAMIDYDRSGFRYENDRTNSFAVTIKNEKGFLTDIIEKPTEAEIAKAADANGFVGVSMNLWGFSYDSIFTYLESVDFHPVRNEKELPAAVKMMIGDDPESLFAYRLSEHVPDLTSKSDILAVRSYLTKEFPDFL